MTDSQHTPEPWEAVYDDYRGDICFSGEGRWSINPVGCYMAANDDWEEAVRDECTANAHRIVACVNACAGIPTEDLAAGVVERMAEAKAKAKAYYAAHKVERQAYALARSRRPEVIARAKANRAARKQTNIAAAMEQD